MKVSHMAATAWEATGLVIRWHYRESMMETYRGLPKSRLLVLGSRRLHVSDEQLIQTSGNYFLQSDALLTRLRKRRKTLVVRRWRRQIMDRGHWRYWICRLYVVANPPSSSSSSFFAWDDKRKLREWWSASRRWRGSVSSPLRLGSYHRSWTTLDISVELLSRQHLQYFTV